MSPVRTHARAHTNSEGCCVPDWTWLPAPSNMVDHAWKSCACRGSRGVSHTGSWVCCCSSACGSARGWGEPPPPFFISVAELSSISFSFLSSSSAFRLSALVLNLRPWPVNRGTDPSLTLLLFYNFTMQCFQSTQGNIWKFLDHIMLYG